VFAYFDWKRLWKYLNNTQNLSISLKESQGKTIIFEGQGKVREFYFLVLQKPVKSIKRSKMKKRILMAYKRS